jgi:hypothetical protein
MGPDWTVPWDLKKIRKKGECPPDLDGCFKGVGPRAKEAAGPDVKATEKTKKTPVCTYKVKSLTLGEVEALAQFIAAGSGRPEAMLRVIGPNDEDLTAAMSTVWKGKIPMVRDT